MVATTKTRRTRRSTLPPNRKPISVTLDDNTRSLLNRIQHVWNVSYEEVVRRILKDIETGKINRSALRGFYTKLWHLALPLDRTPSRVTRFNFTDGMKEVLDEVSNEVLKLKKERLDKERNGDEENDKPLVPNQSEAFRLVITFYALKHNFAKVHWIKTPTFPVNR